MTTYGTSRFVSLEAAIAYYLPYYYPIARDATNAATSDAVTHRVFEGEIHILVRGPAINNT